MSPRFAAPVALVLLLALLPTAIHSYVGLRADDGLTITAIPETLDGFVGTKTTRNPTWGQRRFDATEWIERNYRSGSRDVRLVVVRSFDLKKLYHHPELAVAYGTDLRAAGITRIPSGPDAVHVLESAGGPRQIALYTLMYDDGFVEDPIWFQLRTAGKLLVSGRKQMTLFFAHQADVPDGDAAEKSAAAVVLKSAVAAFRQQRVSPTAPAN